MQYYTCETIKLPAKILEIPYAYTASSKNIYNVSLYIVKHLANSYEKYTRENKEVSYVLKSNLHEHTIEILELANNTVDFLNTKAKIKNKELQYSHYEPEINSNTYYQFLNANFINNLLKLKEHNSIYRDYTQTSSHIANVAVERAIQDYKNYLTSIKDYYKNSSKYLGKPKLPKYKAKLSRLGYDLDKNKLTKDGFLARVITQDNINLFTSIKDKANINKIYISANKKELVNSSDIEIYNNYSFTEVINKTVSDVQARNNKSLDSYSKKNNRNEDNLSITSKVEFVSLKFTPNEKLLLNGKPKVIVEAVLKHTVNLPDHNLLSEILKINGKFLELSDKDKIIFIQEHYPKHDLTHHLASIDLGLVNHATMSFNNHSKGIIISGKKYNNYVANKVAKLDGIKYKIIPESIRKISDNHKLAKEKYKLDVKNLTEKLTIEFNKENKNCTNKEKLNLDEIIKETIGKELTRPILSVQDRELIITASNSVYNDKEYIFKLNKLDNYKKNYLHKLSSSIIDICIHNKVDYLIIGKNDLWKNGLNLGVDNNRKMHGIAHTDLINYIKYKALLFGIIVLVTEESYSSKTSFVNNSSLKKYNKVNNKKINNENKLDKLNIGKKILNKESIKTNQPSAKPNPKSRIVSTFGGRRQSRGHYVNEGLNKVIHADINGSYNIMRKIFTHLCYNRSKHNLAYKIMAVQSNKSHLQSLNS